MTQKEMQIISALQMNEVDYQYWGTWNAIWSSKDTHGTTEDVDIPFPHFYVYRETGNNEKPRLSCGQNLNFPVPDLTLETESGQIIDFYYIKMED